MQRRRVLAAGLGFAAATGAARAQGLAFPSRPIRIIVPYPAGSSPDVVARILAEKLAGPLGQQVLVDNRAGAGGMLGAEAAVGVPADGHTLLFTVKAVMAIVPHLYPNARYRPLQDFRPLTQILLVPHILTAAPNTPFGTMAEFVAHARANPGRIDYASLGAGSQPHVAMEAWAARLGLKLNHVPYRANPAPDVMNGVVSLSLEASTTAIPSIQGGRIKALAVSGAERVAAVPNVPTMTEYRADLDPDGIIGSSWHGVFAPAGTPNEVAARLESECAAVVRLPDVQARLRSLGLTPTGASASVLASGMAADYAYWGGLIRDLGIRLE